MRGLGRHYYLEQGSYLHFPSSWRGASTPGLGPGFGSLPVFYNIYMIPASGFVAPPPEWVGSTQEKGRSSMLVCVEASQHALHVYIHTHRLYIHTYILTDKYIHTPIHACTCRHAPPHPQGGRGILYIHTYILTDKYIHTPIHARTYRHPPPPTGGAGHTIHTHIHTYIQIHTYTIPFGGGGWGLQTWTIYYIYIYVPVSLSEGGGPPPYGW